MKKLLASLLAVCSLTVVAQTDIEALEAKALRSFQWEEWSSASALYGLLISRQPELLEPYARAIVAAQMIPDPDTALDILQQAMAHGIGLDDIFAKVKTYDFEIGQGDIYGGFLLQLKQRMPYMERAIDSQLLDYYDFRNDGPNIVKYAQIMLGPLPGSIQYLHLLARGYVLCDDFDNAGAIYSKILEIDPADKTASVWLQTLKNR